MVGHVGIGCSVVGFLESWSVEQRQGLFGVGLACTLCCVVITWSISQTELMRDIVTSFDFLFLSFQITSAQLCACDIFYWDARCLGLLSFWLWVHFVLTTDALTPVVRQKIAFTTGISFSPCYSSSLGKSGSPTSLLSTSTGNCKTERSTSSS
uniref:Uncharacterized protein n=1 Tax=Globisporangium ultimum (strain ATCC 200006 / CBS 805.95 / DAOM BR144) TaxID=431595 RepID=K3WWK5_GLOUD